MKIHIVHRPLHQEERTTRFDGLVVLITGAAGAGKSTLARRLRQRLGLHHLEWPGSYNSFRAETATIEKIATQGGAAVCLNRTADADEVRDIFGEAAHLHVRRPGEMLVDTSAAPWTGNLLNTGTPEELEQRAIAWLRTAGLLPPGD